MDIEKRTITIKRCPLCSLSHTYSLEVEVSHVWGLTLAAPPEPKTVSFTRLFTCPGSAQTYQATLRLQEDFNSPIKAVRVTGIAPTKNERNQ